MTEPTDAEVIEMAYLRNLREGLSGYEVIGLLDLLKEAKRFGLCNSPLYHRSIALLRGDTNDETR